MPAEWEPQEAVWLSWPHNRKTWPGTFRPIPAKFAEIAAAISRFEKVRINIAQPAEPRARALLERAGADRTRVEFYDHPTNDAWCRDHGPIFVRNDRTGEVAVTDWEYNAWGGKYPPFDQDNQIPPRIAQALRPAPVRRRDGARRRIDRRQRRGAPAHDRGVPAESEPESAADPGADRADAARLSRGHAQVLWLGDGILGDDTDGHVDDLSALLPGRRDCDRGREEPRAIQTTGSSRENLERLQALRTPAGRKFKIVELPMPEPPISTASGCRRATRIFWSSTARC